MQNQQILCALDTGDLDLALSTIHRLAPHVGGFKIGHALTLRHGLKIIEPLRNAGAEKIFLDLKFHDIPNSVALAVRQAAEYGVWMLTLHSSGGSEMMAAAAEEARRFGDTRPKLVGVSVLTSLSDEALNQELGVPRTASQHALELSGLAMESGLDGVVCSPHEAAAMREKLGSEALIVTPGIRAEGGAVHDQKRVGTARQALADGASYLVIGRALTEAEDIEQALAALGFGLATQAT